MSNQSSGEAYFDNLVINMSPGLLLEERHYYPYGLPVAGMGRATAGNLKNKLRYQGNEYREEAGLNWMDFHNRQYDPQLGRFLGIDPMADAGGQQVLSPFHAMACNPVSFTDPMGLISGLMNMPPQGSIPNAGMAFIENQVVSLSGAFVGGRGSLASLIASLMFAENLPTFLAANLMNSALNGGATNSAENANQDYFISLEVDKAKEENKKGNSGEPNDGGGDENKNSSNLVLDKKDVKKATSSGVPTPDLYLENNGKKDYYIKPEDNGEAIVVKPGQVYIGRIDGFATEELGVYKVPDFTRVTVAPEGYLIFTRSWLMGAVHRVLNKNIERLDQNWLQDRHNNNDNKWDKLFNSIR